MPRKCIPKLSRAAGIHVSMALSSAGFGLRRVGRILSDRIGQRAQHTSRIGIFKRPPTRRPFFLREDFLVLSCSVVARHLCWGSLADGEDRVYWHPAAGPYISLVTIPHAADPAPVPTRLCPSLIRFQVMRFSRRNTRSITGLDPAQFETSRNIFIWRTLSENSLLANK
jgi:hypothetical protein